MAKTRVEKRARNLLTVRDNRRRFAATARRQVMANPFVHVELNTNDLAKAKAFYSRLFGWKLEDVPMPGGESYTMIAVGEGTGGGMLKNPVPGTPSHWLAYIGVDDVAASTRNARELGAKVKVDKMEVGEFGWMSVITDPTGATVAFWQAKQPQKAQK
jgi:predicted enzyme related to lactoylglutathione lyase